MFFTVPGVSLSGPHTAFCQISVGKSSLWKFLWVYFWWCWQFWGDIWGQAFDEMSLFCDFFLMFFSWEKPWIYFQRNTIQAKCRFTTSFQGYLLSTRCSTSGVDLDHILSGVSNLHFLSSHLSFPWCTVYKEVDMHTHTYKVRNCSLVSCFNWFQDLAKCSTDEIHSESWMG